MTQITFEFTDDYKTQFKTYVDDLFARTKRGEPELADRKSRMRLIETLIDTYVQQTGERPDQAQLDRLATLCLYEEVTDATPWKTRNTEYPVHSERQREEIERHEVGMAPLEYLANDGQKHEKPTRRKRSKAENAYMDRKYKSKKGER